MNEHEHTMCSFIYFRERSFMFVRLCSFVYLSLNFSKYINSCIYINIRFSTYLYKYN
ncbi:hypothetical protein Hanom_Chr08g00744891 [Helianthus anomalus]